MAEGLLYSDLLISEEIVTFFADQFQHTDGTPVDYVNWANGEPSGAVGGVAQDCVELYPDSYGKWNDEDCGATAGYVCKKPKCKHRIFYIYFFI